MGVKDSFKLCAEVLKAYAAQILDEEDGSVELYLLNFWVKEHSVRDLCDRISLASQGTEYFPTLLEWFKKTILDVQNDWRLCDLRKITALVARSILDKRCGVARGLIRTCVEKEGRDKALQTMEI